MSRMPEAVANDSAFSGCRLDPKQELKLRETILRQDSRICSARYVCPYYAKDGDPCFESFERCVALQMYDKDDGQEW